MRNWVVVGAERIEKQLRFLGEYVKDHADPVFRKHAEHQKSKLSKKKYPPELPNQKYLRTFELQRSFGVRKLGTSQYAITNDRKGAVFVIKRGMQNKKYHAWRWWTVDAEIESDLPILGKSLVADIDDNLERF